MLKQDMEWVFGKSELLGMISRWVLLGETLAMSLKI